MVGYAPSHWRGWRRRGADRGDRRRMARRWQLRPVLIRRRRRSGRGNRPSVRLGFALPPIGPAPIRPGRAKSSGHRPTAQRPSNPRAPCGPVSDCRRRGRRRRRRPNTGRSNGTRHVSDCCGQSAPRRRLADRASVGDAAVAGAWAAERGDVKWPDGRHLEIVPEGGSVSRANRPRRRATSARRRTRPDRASHATREDETRPDGEQRFRASTPLSPP